GGWCGCREGGPEGFMAFDEAIGFALYDGAGVATLGPGVEVERDGTRLRVRDRGEVVAELDDEELAPVPARATPRPRPFNPPAFGLTVLGSSHGFDPAGKTTGLVLWVDHRAVRVAPPTVATDTLRAAGVPPATVDAVILTHCHADHDAGVFQKILEEGRVSLFTTPTILGSFLKKYVALSSEPEERLRRLFVFRPATIGARHRIQGPEFNFFYS